MDYWEILILRNIYVFVLAIVLAMLEIQIEGPAGWAANLPTWRPNKDKWYTKFWASLFSEKELTGYHLVVYVFVTMIFHLPFVFGVELNWDNWLRTMAIYFNFILLWDFLWFVLNPAFTIKKFNARSVTWHKKWFWIMPLDYYDNIFISVVLLVILSGINHSTEPIIWGAANILIFVFQLLIVMGFTSFILQTQKWKRIKPKAGKKKKED